MADAGERYDGTHISVIFDATRCIHSRNCVLGLPEVFVPNAAGPWIHPDKATAEAVTAVALSCPSGAIRYARHDGAAQESPPSVNTVRIRENGPLAFHAELTVAGDATSSRATLCRCGASQKKPYCDGSHHQANFEATGEPATATIPSMPRRNGPLKVTPTPNGPLLVVGSAEIVSGTGRTVTKTEKAFLCRCGASENKPFCDGTHAKVGFKA
jgi:CDGSH-type Zn-finger protein